MLHKLRNPQRFLFLEKDSHTEICFPGDSCICLPTCVLHSPPKTVQTLPKQGTQLPPPPLGLQKYSVCWPTDNWDQGAEESRNTPYREDTSVPLHQIWKTKRWQWIITCSSFFILSYDHHDNWKRFHKTCTCMLP